MPNYYPNTGAFKKLDKMKEEGRSFDEILAESGETSKVVRRWATNRGFNDEALKAAYEVYLAGGISMAAAAKKYGLTRSILNSYHIGRTRRSVSGNALRYPNKTHYPSDAQAEIQNPIEFDASDPSPAPEEKPVESTPPKKKYLSEAEAAAMLIRDLQKELARVADQLREQIAINKFQAAQITDKNSEIHDLRIVNRDLKRQLNEMSIFYNNKLSELEAGMKEANSVYTEELAKHAKAEDELTRQIVEAGNICAAHAAETADLKTAHEAEVAELNANHAAEIESMQAAHEAEVSDLKAAHETEVHELNELIALYDEDLKTANASGPSAEAEEKDNELFMLRNELDAYRKSAPIMIGDEQAFYEGEFKDIIIEALGRSLSSFNEGSRYADVITDLINNNPHTDTYKEMELAMSKIAATKFGNIMLRNIAAANWRFSASHSNHKHIFYFGDPRYMTIATTSDFASCNRTAKNMVGEMKKCIK